MRRLLPGTGMVLCQAGAWFDYEQYKPSRTQSAQARVVAEQQAAGQDVSAKRSVPPAPE